MYASNKVAHEMKPCFAGEDLQNGVACLEWAGGDYGKRKVCHLAGGSFQVLYEIRPAKEAREW